jgi:hypothetical protein
VCLILVSVLLAPPAWAQEAVVRECPDGQEKTVEFEATLRVDNDFNPDTGGLIRYNLRFQRFEGQASIRLFRSIPCKVVKEILFVVRSKMEQDLIVNGILDANHLTPIDYLKEAYIEFKQVGGLPIAVIVGTSEVTYGQDFPGTIDFQNDASHVMTDPDQGQVKGFTIVLDKALIKVFDSLEFDFFTPDPDFLKGSLSHLDGFAFRVSKSLGDHLATEASFMRKGNAFDPTLKPETKVSVGATFRQGMWTIWGEGVAMKNSAAYPGSPFGVTAGVHRITGPGQIDVEATAIRKTLKQVAVAYELYLTKHFTVGPTFRYTYCVGGNAGCMAARGYGQGPSLGISARLTFGGGEDNENPTWWGNKGTARIRKLFLGKDRRKNR